MFDIECLLEIGEDVIITIPKEHQKSADSPYPSGARATILAFGEIHYGRTGNTGFKPGVYVNHSLAKVRLENGHEYMEFVGRLKLADQAEWRRRMVAAQKYLEENPDAWLGRKFLRELPETPFWEDDIVRVSSTPGITSLSNTMLPGRDLHVFEIVGIDYGFLYEKTQSGAKYPAYKISSELCAGWNTSASEDDMVLIERGRVWKYFHDEPITFENITKEAQFFAALGHTEELRNPIDGTYTWTRDEVLAAIRNGTVHGFSTGGFFGNGMRVSARRFRDEDLGRRVAQATLEGFEQALR